MRSDVQHTVKCLASYLSAPTQHAWTQLGRLIGYLQRTVGYGVQMQCTQPGMSLFEKLADSGKQNSEFSCLVESFSDSDWQGGKDLRSTSSAAHYINGNLIHSSSRTQHVVSLSSTEAEYYAMTSTCIDTIYVKHILEFLLSREVEAQVKVDNSATRQIANELGTSKLQVETCERKIAMGTKPSQGWSAQVEANSYDVKSCRFGYERFEQKEAQHASFSLRFCGRERRESWRS